MDSRDKAHRTRFTFLLFLLVAAPSSASEPIVLTAFPQLVSGVIRDAATMLATSECQAVFSDFRDAEGKTLKERLDVLGQTGERYLGRLLFYSGDGSQGCERRHKLAFTSPGSHVIYICESQFSIAARRSPGLAAATIIHEELHSLGLGENPPTSTAITERVTLRCVR